MQFVELTNWFDTSEGNKPELTVAVSQSLYESSSISLSDKHLDLSLYDLAFLKCDEVRRILLRILRRLSRYQIASHPLHYHTISTCC